MGLVVHSTLNGLFGTIDMYENNSQYRLLIQRAMYKMRQDFFKIWATYTKNDHELANWAMDSERSYRTTLIDRHVYYRHSIQETKAVYLQYMQNLTQHVKNISNSCTVK